MQYLASGATLQNGKYRIERVLGQGGFGITYLAEQPMLGRKVAIKEFFMSSCCARKQGSLGVECTIEQNRELVNKCKQKFLKEARTIARLAHKNIPVVHDVFEENHTAYYVMECIDGSSLDKCSRRFSEKESLNIIRQVAEALQYMHSQKILHLDVKPANIILKKGGTVMLIDYGISKHYTMNGYQSSTSPIGISRGYAPIEQYSQDVGSFTPATDIYSLGATLYWLLTGQRPPESISLRDTDLAVCPNGVSETTWSVVKCSMKRDRQDRVQNIKEFLNQFNKIEKERSQRKTVPYIYGENGIVKGSNPAILCIDIRQLSRIGGTGMEGTYLFKGNTFTGWAYSSKEYPYVTMMFQKGIMTNFHYHFKEQICMAWSQYEETEYHNSFLGIKKEIIHTGIWSISCDFRINPPANSNLLNELVSEDYWMKRYKQSFIKDISKIRAELSEILGFDPIRDPFWKKTYRYRRE